MVLAGAQIESNVRYVPHCMVEDRHRQSVYHFQQLFYDQREWDLNSWAWTTLPPQREAIGPLSPPISLSSLSWWVWLNGLLARLLPKRTGAREMLSVKRLVNDRRFRRVLYWIQGLVPRAPIEASDATKARIYSAVARLHAEVDCRSVYAAACDTCAARPICTGIYREYDELFGSGEAASIRALQPIADPLHYIRHQSKLVEKEDETWALGESS